MCIIVYKPKNVKLDKKVFQNCFDNNPDGAGFMYPEEGKVYVSKGYMTFDEFWANAKKIPKDVPVVYHFRITTHGGTKPALTHPYPITDNYEYLHALDVLCDTGVAHNGIFYNLPDVDGESDTTVFISNVLNPLAKLARVEKTTLTDLKYKDMLEFLCGGTYGSRLAIMDKNGDVRLCGSGWVNNKGCYFSNSSYSDYYSYYTTKTYYDYDYGYKNKDSNSPYDKTKSVITPIDTDHKEVHEIIRGKIVDKLGNEITVEDDCHSYYYDEISGVIYKYDWVLDLITPTKLFASDTMYYATEGEIMRIRKEDM